MSAGQEQAWHALMGLHELVPTDRSLVGGQMVHLHARPADSRARPDATRTGQIGSV